jgi:hypothetical protein
MMDFLTGRASEPPPECCSPPNLMHHARKVLHRLGAQVVTCSGEADAALVRDFHFATDLAVLSGDSDFFCANVRFLPLDQTTGLALALFVEPRPHVPGSHAHLVADQAAAAEFARIPLTGTVLTYEEVCRLLQLPPCLEVLEELSTLAGNDYSKPVLDEHAATLCPALGLAPDLADAGHQRVLQICASLTDETTGRWAAGRWQTHPLSLRALLQQLAAAGEHGASELLAAHEFLVAGGDGDEARIPPPPTAPDVAGSVLYAMLRADVLPNTAMDVLYQSRCSVSPRYELIDEPTLCPGTPYLLRRLQAALCLLLGHPSAVERRARSGVLAATEELLPGAVLPDYPVVPGTILAHLASGVPLPAELQRQCLLLPVVGSGSVPQPLSTAFNATAAAAALPLPALAVVHIVWQSFAAGQPLPSAVALAMLASVFLPPPPEFPPAPEGLRPSAAAVTALSYFVAVYSSLHTLAKVLSLPDSPAQPAITHGVYFQQLLLSLLVHDVASESGTAWAEMAALGTQGGDSGFRDTALFAELSRVAMYAAPQTGLDMLLHSGALQQFGVIVHGVQQLCSTFWLADDNLFTWAGAFKILHPSMFVVPPAHYFAANDLEAVCQSAYDDSSKSNSSSNKNKNNVGDPAISAAAGVEFGAGDPGVAPSAVSDPLPALQGSVANIQPDIVVPQRSGPAMHANDTELPIMAFQDQILGHVANNLLTVIQADTGAGKSTRVPQMLFRHNPGSRIIVTQPRRMAATSLARHVALEMKTPLGGLVGYRIGNERHSDEHTRITYVTCGWLLYKLFSSPDYLDDVTHVVLDEIHEVDFFAVSFCFG